MRWHIEPDNRGRDTRQRGFTLVEILVTLVIVSLAALITIPTLQRVRVKTRGEQALRAVSTPFTRARFEATKRHSPVGVVYDRTGSPPTIMVFEDWDPNDNPGATNGNGVHDGNEEVFLRMILPGQIEPIAKPSGDTSTVSELSTVVYGTDGSLRAGGGAAFFQDTQGNFFRVNINPVTGEVREEGWLGGPVWTPKKEAWEWKF